MITLRHGSTLFAVALSSSLAGCGNSGSNAPAAPANTTDASIGATPRTDAGIDAAATPKSDAGNVQMPVDAAVDASPPVDSLALSFVFVGGCRNAVIDATNNPSSANLAQLKQTLVDIGAMSDAPKYFFFVGDLVDGLVSGSTTLSTQLNAWADVWKGSTLPSKLTLVPIAGNHEVLYIDKNQAEASNPVADNAWTAWLHTNNFDAHAGNGPTNGGTNLDALQDDQSKLNYSFDDGAAHFVVLNTDTWTTTQDTAHGPTALGWVPMHWLTADIQAAQANPNVTGIYVFGHKPLMAPGGSTSSSDAIHPTLAPMIVQLLNANTKVRAYLTSHAHLWNKAPLPGTRGVPQIIVGNGGSPIETTWTEPHPYYGFTELKIYASGRAGIVSYQRPVPTPYNAAATVAAIAQTEIPLTP